MGWLALALAVQTALLIAMNIYRTPDGGYDKRLAVAAGISGLVTLAVIAARFV